MISLKSFKPQGTLNFFMKRRKETMEKSITYAPAAQAQNKYQRNLRLILAETILTSVGAGFSVSTITEFWKSVGMDQTEIGLVQMLFTVVVLLLDIPMGYLADRFNRKIMNIIGDIGVAIGFMLYAFTNSMYTVLAAECTLGLFTAMTSGVDQTFLKTTCKRIDPSKSYLSKVTSNMYTGKYIAMIIVIFIGGFISKISLRLAIGLSFLPYFIGGIISMWIVDYGDNSDEEDPNMLKDMKKKAKKLLEDKKVKLYMACYVIGREITHPHIWVLTPMLLMCGVPLELTCLGWILNHVMKIFGARFSNKLADCKTSTKFMILMITQFTWLLVLIIHTNIFTVWLFGLNGFVQGLSDVTLVIPLQVSTEDKVQTQVMSMASTGSRLLYIPLVFLVNYLGNIKLELALLGVIAVFLPICLLALRRLKQIGE